MKIHRVGAELFHVEGQTHGQTDMTKLIVIFGNFVNACKQVINDLSSDVLGYICDDFSFCFIFVFIIFFCELISLF